MIVMSKLLTRSNLQIWLSNHLHSFENKKNILWWVILYLNLLHVLLYVLMVLKGKKIGRFRVYKYFTSSGVIF